MHDIRQARIYDDLTSAPPDKDGLERLLAAAPPLPDGLAELILARRDGDPRPGDIWRAGLTEAVLVWVRRVFDDGVADVVPLVLDVELADKESILLPVDATPLATGLAAMVALRTHVDCSTFINRIGQLDIRREVADVMAAMREGRHPRGVHVGPPIVNDRDQRIEYRCAIRDLLEELLPSARGAS